MTTVLIVEDDREVLTVLRELLEGSGYDAFSATGADAVTVAADLQPDVVLMDLVLERGLRGETLLAQLRTQERTAQLRVIVTSAAGDAAHIARRIGADDVLLKPFTIELLVHRIESVLAKNAPHIA